jgi:leader peptidase (prepilin peptidase)/N-methyltransferase
MGITDFIMIFITVIITGFGVNFLIYRLSGNINKSKQEQPGAKNRGPGYLKKCIPFYMDLSMNNIPYVYCNDKSKERKVIIDLLNLVVMVGLFSTFSVTFYFVFYSLVFMILIAVSVIDINQKRIPDITVVYLSILSVIFIVISKIYKLGSFSEPGYLWEQLLGLVPGAGFLFLISVFCLFIFNKEEIIGMGDIKLFIPVGLILGLELCIIAVVLSFLTGGFYVVYLMIRKKRNKDNSTPFAPFITIAVFITIIYGDAMLNYVNNYINTYLKFLT